MIEQGSPIRRLGIVGDLHGEHRRLAMALEWFAGQSVDQLVCTGDVADGRGCINRCCDLLRDGDVQTVAGNHDRWLLEDRVRHVADAHSRDDLSDANAAFMEGLPRQQRLDTCQGPLLLCHGVADNDLARVWPGRKPEEIRRSADLDQLIAEGDYRYLINGHMHFRVLLDFEALTLLNAGTLRGDHAGVTIIDFEEGTITVFSATDEAPPQRLLEKALEPGTERKIWRNTRDFDGASTPVTLYAGF